MEDKTVILLPALSSVDSVGEQAELLGTPYITCSHHHGNLLMPADGLTGILILLILRRPENCNLERSDCANLLRCHGPFN